MDYPIICDDNCFLRWFDNGYEFGEDIFMLLYGVEDKK